MTLDVATRRPQAGPLLVLSRIEIIRTLKSRIFLVGTLGLVVFQAVILHSPIKDANDRLYATALLGAELSLVVAFRLTQSTDASSEALDVAPTALPVRTAALCATAVVWASVGLLSLLATLHWQSPVSSHVLGAFNERDRIAVLAGQLLLPCIGGPLLGVAAARWLSRSWAVVVVPLGLIAWMLAVTTVAGLYQDVTGVALLRTASPFVLWTVADSDGTVATWRGSPQLFLVWQVCLCVVAVAVAMLRGASPTLRRRLRRILAVAVVLSAVACVLAATGGSHAAVVTTTAGAVPGI